ncbi:hypothetical protein BDV23DRAFT_184820 [Aspergillus alliaceus]|uniref:Uncharacterized protein n=1 Tax=Petromyces alliaceus TaxID=209559 RepID=A0A5N6FHV5_PETAA|nr:uncharacterized protein BDW43DRAFT_314756 [Aspergillus alliaceus]KAB8229556.1 hypothetical protein BDW43DRAFT_314756 [Aspergillus alliaceus]KAE8388969.1 hypothetical protein BDV23DRAFT_184820 [Aspergillus alliaceus]
MANLKDMEYGISSRVQTEWSNTKFSIALATTAAASTTFSMVAVHSSSEIQYASFNAAKSSIYASLSKQGASCARPKARLCWNRCARC